MKTGFYQLHPIPAFLYYVGVLTFTMLFFHPLFLITSCILMLCLWLMVDTQSKKKKLLIAYSLMAGMLLIFNPIFNRRGATILFYLFDQNITLEAIVYGGLMALLLLSILFAFASYNRILSAHKMMYLFSSLVPRTALVLRLAVRFVPLFLQRWRQVVEVQRTQGTFLSTGSVRVKAYRSMQLFSILLSWSLEEAIETAQSMRARGYGQGRRSSLTSFRMNQTDWSMLSVICVLVALLGSSWSGGWVSYQVYPELAPLSLSFFGSLSYLFFCLFLCLPIFMEIKELYIWHNSRSTISASPIPREKKRL